MVEPNENENNQINTINPNPEPNYSRRDFLKLAGRTAVATLAAATLGSSQNQPEAAVQDAEVAIEPQQPFEQFLAQETELEFPENSFFEFEHGERALATPGMEWTPDGHVPFITAEDGETKRMFVSGIMSGIQGSFPYLWDSKKGFRPETNEQNAIVPAITRDPNETYRNGYCAVTSVVEFNGGYLGFTHNEQHINPGNGAGFTASVGLAQSQNGKTFQPMGQLITGREHSQPGREVTGAGQPHAIKVQDSNTGQEQILLYYIEWIPQESKAKFNTVDQIFMARLPLIGNTIGALEHYTKDGFKVMQPGETPDLQPVITPPASIPGAGYAALPGISYNTKRGEFISTFQTNVGVCASKSADGISWSEGELVIKYPQPLSAVWSNPGLTGHSYPTAMSLDQPNDSFTGEKISMVQAKGIGHNSRHTMTAINGKLKS